MGWRDVAFLHWPVAPAVLRPLLPEPLGIDMHGGQAWVSAVGLRMKGLRLGPVPLASQDFPALNLRTYVVHDGVPGLWFLHAYATDRWYCSVARKLGVPYEVARLTLGPDAMRCETDAGGPFVGTWTSGARPADGALDGFLAERYSSYSVAAGRLLRTDVQHAPWPLDPANARVLGWGALPVPLVGVQPALAHTSPGVEVTMRRAKAVAKVT